MVNRIGPRDRRTAATPVINNKAGTFAPIKYRLQAIIDIAESAEGIRHIYMSLEVTKNGRTPESLYRSGPVRFTDPITVSFGNNYPAFSLSPDAID